MSKNTGGPAFPGSASINRDAGELVPHQFGNNDFMMLGMTLRDYFAAKVMATIMRDAVLPTKEIQDECLPMAAALAYRAADFMIAERDK